MNDTGVKNYRGRWQLLAWLFIIDWTGTLCGKKTRLLAPSAPALVEAIKSTHPVSHIEVLSIANGSSEERSEEIERLLGEAGIRESINKVTIIKPPKKPEHFINAAFDQVVVIGDRPCREIANGNLAKAHTILVQDRKVSECCDEPLTGEFEGVHYAGVPTIHYPSLGSLARCIERGTCGDMLDLTSRCDVMSIQTSIDGKVTQIPKELTKWMF